MWHPRFPFKIGTFFLLLVFLGMAHSWAETSHSGYQKREASLYRDVFDQRLYYAGTQHLYLDRLYRLLSRQRKPALDVNPFDEVPDSNFFTARHGRNRMSLDALKQGSMVTPGPDPSGKWTIVEGKFDGPIPQFIIKDEKGDRYRLKFDPFDFLELVTGAEVVGARLMHAIGYNVPAYTIVYFKAEQLAIDPKARMYDDTGFLKKLTPQRLEHYLLFIPRTSDGSFRASAGRILGGEILGPMGLQGRRKNDPDDSINHEDRREIRALQVFSSWINNYDVRDSNTLDVVETQNGRSGIRHYLFNFNSCLGGIALGPKPPSFGYEYLYDYTEATKGIVGLGFWKRPWEKRWEAAGEGIRNPVVGYFDSRYFDPNRFKTQLSYFPFKDLTRADGFWAAKIVMGFTDEDIKAIVSTGDYSDEKARDEIARTLIERRDLVGRFWFRQANTLDEFKLLQGDDGVYRLGFEDLAVRHGFVPDKTSLYRFRTIGRNGRRETQLAERETREKSFDLNPDWIHQYPAVDLVIRTRRQGEDTWSPAVRVQIQSDTSSGARLAEIVHQD